MRTGACGPAHEDRGVIASLPMYDRAETRDATDRLWQAIARALRARGIDAPDALARDGDPWAHWRAPNLLLSQTCGLPFRATLHEILTLVGTPDYALPGCPPGHYCSVIVARREATPGDGACLAFNDGLSQSGWAAALDWAAATGRRFGALLRTGTHAASARAVAEGRADLAAIDAVTWRLLRRHEGWTAALQVIDATPPTPGLPLVTGAGRDPAPLAAAVAHAIAALAPSDADALGLRGLARIPTEAYLAMPLPPSPAAYAAETGARPIN